MEIVDSKRELLHRPVRVILGKDREVFGADRSSLLRSPTRNAKLRDERLEQWHAPRLPFGARVLFADHLGSWMAEDSAAARPLLHGFLARFSRRL